MIRFTVTTPSVTGTYLAMEPVNFEGKQPFASTHGLGETATRAPVTAGQARTAFDLGWVHDSLIDTMEEIALSDRQEWRAPI